MRRYDFRPRLESLESRRLLAGASVDDFYSIEQGSYLQVGEESSFESIQQTRSHSVGGNVVQIEHSEEFGLLFLRNTGSLLRVLDAGTGKAVDFHFATYGFKDMSLTPDGSHLFVIDSPIRNLGNTSVLHRFDCQLRRWESIRMEDIARSVEAISSEQILIQRYLRHSNSITLAQFDVAANTISHGSSFNTYKQGDLKFDNRKNRFYIGRDSDYSSDLTMVKIVDDEFVMIAPERTEVQPVFTASPIYLSADGEMLYVGSLQVEADDIANVLRRFPRTIVGATPAVAFGSTGGYYESNTGHYLGEFPFRVGPIFVSDNERDVWVFNGESDSIHQYQLFTTARGILANDRSDPSDFLRVSTTTDPRHGVLTIQPDGRFSYTPYREFSGFDSFEYTATTESGETSTATVRIEVTPRQTLNYAPIASDKSFHTDQNTDLSIAELYGDVAAGTRLEATFPAFGNVREIEYSTAHDLLFVRNSGTEIRVIDATTGQLLEVREPIAKFWEMDLTPEGDFLFATDFRGTSDYLEGTRTHHVHRYDLKRGIWTMAVASGVAAQVEAVTSELILMAGTDQHVVTTLHRYSASTSEMTLLSFSRSVYGARIEYDHTTNRVYVGGFGSSSREVVVLKILNDELIQVESTDKSGLSQTAKGKIVLSPSGDVLYYGALQIEALDISNNLRSFREPIIAASNELAIAQGTLYDARSGERLEFIDESSEAHFISADLKHWWYFDPATDHVIHRALDGKRVGLLAYAFDPDGDQLSLAVSTQPIYGRIEIAEDGTTRYIPNRDFVGVDRFGYQVFDGTNYSQEALIEIQVHTTTPVDLRPRGTQDNYSVAPGQSLIVANGNHPHFAPGIELRPGSIPLQVEISPSYGVVAIRNWNSVQVFSIADGQLVSNLDTVGEIKDFDFSPNGRYLFASEKGSNEGETNFIHRFDATSRIWQSKQFALEVEGIEAVSSDRFLASGRKLSLNDFRGLTSGTIEYISQRSVPKGEIAYDPMTRRIYLGTVRSTDRRIYVFRIIEDELIPLQDTGFSGAAQSGGGSLELSSDASDVYYGPLQVEAFDVVNNQALFQESILAANGVYAFGAACIHDTRSGQPIAAHASVVGEAAVSDDGRNVWLVHEQSVQQLVMHHNSQGVLLNDFDPNGHEISAQLETSPGHGTLQLNSDGSFRYEPHEGFKGRDQFSYRVSSAGLLSDPIEVVIDVDFGHQPVVDVNRDRVVSPIDALMVVNELNRNNMEATENRNFDVNGDGVISPIDALLVINYLNSHNPPESPNCRI